MFATSVRVRPCSDLSGPRSVGRVTTIWPSSCWMLMRCGTTWRNSPRGPCTVTRPGSMVTVTPAGTSIGCLPMRLIVSPDEADDLAADALALGGPARDHAAGRGEDRGAHAAEDARQAVLAGVDAAPRLRDALEPVEDALAAASVLEVDHEHAVGEVAGLDVVVPDVALLLQDAGDLLLELGVRHLGAVVQRLVGVADAREHVGDGVGQHWFDSTELSLTTSSSSCRGSRPGGRAPAGRCGRARTS